MQQVAALCNLEGRPTRDSESLHRGWGRSCEEICKSSHLVSGSDTHEKPPSWMAATRQTRKQGLDWPWRDLNGDLNLPRRQSKRSAC